MKKNTFLSKVASSFLTISLLLGSFSSISVYAMEETQSEIVPFSVIECETEEDNDMILLAHGTSVDDIINLDVPIERAGNDVFEYGKTTPVGGFTCTSSNLTPVKSVQEHPSMNRLVVKVKFRKSLQDRGVGAIKLNMYLRRAGTTYNIPMGIQAGTDVCNSTQLGVLMQTNWISISSGEHFQFFFDIVSADSSTANGKPRIAEIEEYWVYCD